MTTCRPYPKIGWRVGAIMVYSPIKFPPEPSPQVHTNLLGQKKSPPFGEDFRCGV